MVTIVQPIITEESRRSDFRFPRGYHRSGKDRPTRIGGGGRVLVTGVHVDGRSGARRKDTGRRGWEAGGGDSESSPP